MADHRIMPTAGTLPLRAFAVLLLALCLAVTLHVSGARAATDPFPMTEPFTSGTFSSVDWHTGGAAYLTASGSGAQDDPAGAGWLRLTDATGDQFGYAINDTAFPSDNGILVNFDYATYGGSGADGLSFFLYDGSTPYDGSFHVGASGGSLGYAPCTDSSGFRPGVPNAYIGVGFDEFGNFTNLGSICGLDGTSARANYVSVRGSAADDYKLLTSVPTAPKSLTGDRTQSRHVTVAVTPDLKLSVYIRYPDGTYQTVAEDYQLPADTVPSTLKFGFAGSTGGSTNIHEIRNNHVVKPADLSTSVSAPQHDFGTDEYTWTVTVANSADNDTVGDTVAVTSPQGGLTDVTWTCTTVPDTATDPNAKCAAASGSGLPDTTVDLPKGATATYTVTAHTESTADYASLSVDAQPTGATGELDPTDNVAAMMQDTDPAVATEPSITVTDTDGLTGRAAVTAGSYDGGDVTVTRTWQACDAGDTTGESCADIAGSTGVDPYTIGSAMRGKALRLHEHAANSQGSVDAYSDIYDTRPETTLTGHPGSAVQATSATFTASADTSGSAFEYQLDGGGWTTTSTFTGLTEGEHTVKARAVYAGLADVTPAGYTWTVDDTAPAKPAITAPANGSVTGDATPALKADAEAGSTVTFIVDGTAVGTATADGDGHATLTPTGALADGSHTVKATATDAAGNTSAASTAVSFTVDTTAPAKPALPDDLDGGSVTEPAAPSKSPTPTLELTGEPSSTIEVYVDGALVDTVALGTDGTATYTLGALADGDHEVTLVDRDSAGNGSEPSEVAYYAIDTAAPGTPTVTFPTAGLVSRDTAPTVTVTAEPGAEVTIEVDGDVHQATADADGNAAVTVPGPLADGPHTVRARATDAAGNAGAWSAQTDWTVKTFTHATLPGPAQGVTATNRPTVTFTGETGATYRVVVDGRVVATGVIDATGQGSLQLPDALADGSHVISVTVTDVAGNEDTQTVTVTVDTSAPAVRFTGAPAQQSSDRNPTFTFTGEPGAGLQCSLDGAGWTTCTASLSFSGVADGPHVLRVRAVDAAGNVSADRQYAWTVDTSRPAAPAVLGGPDAQTDGHSARFEFTPEPGATLACSLDGDTYEACPPVLSLRRLKAGRHTLRVRQTDAAGNVSGVNVYRWTVTARPKTRKAKRVEALLGKPATVSDRRVAAVGCNLNAGALTSCVAALYHHGRRIGRATKRTHGRHARTVVRVRLNKRGRRLLGRALGGLPVTAKVKARSRDGRLLRDRAKGTLYPPTVFSVPVLFDTDRFGLDRVARRTVHAIAREIRHARRVTCEGYTDSRGRARYNHRLGRDRARTVCRRLRRLRVRGRMRAVSYGETRPAAGNRTARGRHANRRVLVRVSY